MATGGRVYRRMLLQSYVFSGYAFTSSSCRTFSLTPHTADFPLSSTYTSLPNLSEAHLQLAAQIPSRWLDTPASRSAAELAIRKIVYRALLDAHLPPPSALDADITRVDRANKVYRPRGTPAPGPTSGSGTGALHRRLGKLPDSAYTSFPHFLAVASERLGIPIPIATPQEDNAWFQRVQSQIEVLHVLRCIMGPCIESAIVADRVEWLREVLQVGKEGEGGGKGRWDVEVVGLFDQAEGSARNFAIVVY